MVAQIDARPGAAPLWVSRVRVFISVARTFLHTNNFSKAGVCVMCHAEIVRIARVYAGFLDSMGAIPSEKPAPSTKCVKGAAPEAGDRVNFPICI
jgi:hypothetical protein